MKWCEIRQNNEYLQYISRIWVYEQNLSKWFLVANSLWTETEADFAQFVADCGEIWGLFGDDGALTACVYVERQNSPEIMNIHLSIIEKIKPSVFIAESANLRNLLLRRGVRTIRGWILQKNFGLCRILQIIGFARTSLVMRHGFSHNQVLKWELVELRRG